MLEKIIKGTVLIVATIVLTLAACSSTIFAAAKAPVTPSWGSWKDTTITYKTSKTSSYYKGVWKDAVKRWNKVGVVQLKAAKSGEKADITLTSSASLSTKSGKLAGYTNYSYINKGNNDNQIVSAKSTLNRSLLTKYGYTKNQRTNVATHEIGHALGLSHSSSKKSVMYASDRYASIDHQDKVGLDEAYGE
ncbi:matrixin family metalloprotease [Levilactobacillus yonginensis]|uniref:matrixin family metalloprotease n=1 Tax=Levilactobacillus yonginensis TaxID=1054041 RepID=UPI00345DA06D